MKRSILMLVAMLMLFACQSQEAVFNLEKDGVVYNYNEVITFYHPREWTVTKDELKLSLDIINEVQKEAFYFDTFETESSNSQDELMALYEAKLKDLEVEIARREETQLQSGQHCFLLEGSISKNQLAFCEVVVFIGQKQYIYSYIADTNVYDEHHEMMENYLKSLVVNEAMKTAL